MNTTANMTARKSFRKLLNAGKTGTIHWGVYRCSGGTIINHENWKVNKMQKTTKKGPSMAELLKTLTVDQLKSEIRFAATYHEQLQLMRRCRADGVMNIAGK